VLSPDGKKVAVTTHGDQQDRIAIYEVGKWAKPVRQLSTGGQKIVRAYQWAGNDRVIVSQLSVFTFGGLIIPSTKLIAYTVSSDKVMPIGSNYGLIGDNIVHLDPEGRFILLAQNDSRGRVEVDRIDLTTGSVTQVQEPRPGVDDWFADTSGVIRAGVDYSGRRWRIHYRENASAPWRIMKTSPIEDDKSVVEKVRLTSDLNKGFIVTNARTGRFGVYNYDFGAEAIGAPVFEHPTADIDAVLMSDAENSVDGVRYEDDRPRTAWLNPAYAEIQQRLDKALPNRTNRIINRSRGGDHILLSSESASDPGGYYIYDRQAKRIEQFAQNFGRIDPKTLSPVQTIQYTARDGMALSAYLTVPARSTGRNLPLILMPHGGPFERDHWEYDPAVQFLASRGYAVLQPQFRGSTGRGRSLVESGYGQWGLKMQDDLDDAVDWAARSGIVDPKRACIVGISYGGYAALWGALRNPDRYRCAVSVAGVSDLRAMLKYDSRFLLARRYVPQWRAKVMGEEKRDLTAVSPIRHAASLRIPLMIVHGEKDDNVPVAQSRDMVKALQRSNRPVETVFYPNSGHGPTNSRDLADYLARLEAFLAKHNPASSL